MYQWIKWASTNNYYLKLDISIDLRLNPLSPHDALKHHFTSLKTDLIFLQLGVLELNFPWNWFTNTWLFFQFFTHVKSSGMTMVNSGLKGLIETIYCSSSTRVTRVKCRWTITLLNYFDKTIWSPRGCSREQCLSQPFTFHLGINTKYITMTNINI